MEHIYTDNDYLLLESGWVIARVFRCVSIRTPKEEGYAVFIGGLPVLYFNTAEAAISSARIYNRDLMVKVVQSRRIESGRYYKKFLSNFEICEEVLFDD